MGTIRKYKKRDESLTFHAEVRLKGHSAKRASFPTYAEASHWIKSTERDLLSPPKFSTKIRHDWTIEEIHSLYELPLQELIYKAHKVHRSFHSSNEVQLCQLLSIKTGGCSEDCGYCAQSSHHKTDVQPTPMMTVEEVLKIANTAKKNGVTRICLGAAWKLVRTSPQFSKVLQMVSQINELGIEVCCTLGMLNDKQAFDLKKAGLYAYNHNLDTSENHYKKIISSHTYDDRLKTLKRVSEAGISICCGGIFGLGESLQDRFDLLKALSSLSPHPDSVPLNRLEAIPGTPLEKQKPIPVIEHARMIALARIMMPKAMIRLSAGRHSMTDAEQALCFHAGANSMFVGEKLLTVPNPSLERDNDLIKSMKIIPKPAFQKNKIFLQSQLEKREKEGTLRTLQFKRIDAIDFASNDYLGLASCPKLAKIIEEEFNQLVYVQGIRPNIGATGSRLLTGNQPYLEELEESIAKYHDEKTALLFNSGYSANTGLLSCIAKENDALILDSQVHASTWDGARLSRAKSYLFRHNDLESLEKQLKRAHKLHREVFVCVESLYSMCGDLAPLSEIHQLCEQYQAWMIVDEAHSTGILGEKGKGLTHQLSNSSRVIARIHTFGKALGHHGAAIIGNAILRKYLINECRTFIYTTALPLHTLVSIDCIYKLLPQLDKERAHLNQLIRYFSMQIGRSPLPIHTTSTTIQSIPIQGSEEVVRVSENIQKMGIDVRAIRYPTVRKGSECLRVCLHSFNSTAEINQLIHVLEQEREEVYIA